MTVALFMSIAMSVPQGGRLRKAIDTVLVLQAIVLCWVSSLGHLCFYAYTSAVYETTANSEH
jgi:hypothetical protein